MSIVLFHIMEINELLSSKNGHKKQRKSLKSHYNKGQFEYSTIYLLCVSQNKQRNDIKREWINPFKCVHVWENVSLYVILWWSSLTQALASVSMEMGWSVWAGEQKRASSDCGDVHCQSESGSSEMPAHNHTHTRARSNVDTNVNIEYTVIFIPGWF